MSMESSAACLRLQLVSAELKNNNNNHKKTGPVEFDRQWRKN